MVTCFSSRVRINTAIVCGWRSYSTFLNVLGGFAKPINNLRTFMVVESVFAKCLDNALRVVLATYDLQ